MSQPELVPPLFAMGTSVYAQRDGEILILRRAVGAMSGSWYLPGGALDPGETLEQCAARELREESGLEPAGPLALIGIVPMHVYDHETLIVGYACDVKAGEVKLSHEHSDSRWIRPRQFRDEFFAEENVRAIETRNERVGSIVRGIQQDLDRYLAWLEREQVLQQVRGGVSAR
ncbi:MAG: NUDIX domain-containing protein [Deltaproteobacteria bacterium]|nr:NUDIX domain-containing protein [Deltaproteobacteria bacterium]MBW2413774.1 NUDIX domain-containing protein [Deltaproteobacteria bacterium]